MQKRVGKSFYLNLILNIVIIFFCLLLIGEVIFKIVYINIYVKGSSMAPTLTGAPSGDGVLEGGDYVFVNKRANPDYFDIVVVKTLDEQGEQYDIIKRVVAFGGDAVKIDRGQLWIKYKGNTEYSKISEPYVTDEFNHPLFAINNLSEHVVEDGCMFLLGDNRDNSRDSRERGDYPMSSLVGVVSEWSLKHKSQITAFYTFFEFKLGFNKISKKLYGN